MKDLAENNLIRFKNILEEKRECSPISRSKDQRAELISLLRFLSIFLLLKSILRDPLEKIIEECAQMAVENYKRPNCSSKV